MLALLLFFSICAGGLAFLTLLQLAGGRLLFLKTRTQRALSSAARPARKGGGDPPADLSRLGGLARRLAEAGLGLPPGRFALLCVCLGILGMLAGWIFFIPGLPAVAIGAACGYAPFVLVRERTQTRGERIDRELPLTLARIAVGLEAGTALATILTDASAHLPPGSLLSGELARTAQDMLSDGEEAALGKLAGRSASVSLANAAMMLQSFTRAGGPQYAEAVSEAAVNVQRMIEVRNTARARAAQALQAAAVIPLILAFVLVSLAADPSIGASFQEPAVQVVIVLVMLVMGTGYLFMRSQVRKVV